MKRPICQTLKNTGIFVITIVVLGWPLVATTPAAYAQCTALSPGECRPETHHPKDFGITQSQTFWTVVGVLPSQGDDKDLYLFDGCLTGWGLAGSTGINGADFIVGDFNHNIPGSYYPQTLYGDTAAAYTVYWNEGGSVFPIGSMVDDVVGGAGAGCNMIRVWDIFLEIGAEYRFTWVPPVGFEANVALFRNPGTDEYWAPRNDAEFELTASGSTVYTAPADDWFGLVVFPTWDTSATGTFELEIERINNCRTITSGDCQSHTLYTPATGAGNDFEFTQNTANWAVVSVVPDETDTKTLDVYTQCDAGGSILGSSFTAGTGSAEFVVGDFNHNGLDSYYARVDAGQSDAPFSIQFDSGSSFFAVPGEVTGALEGCSAVAVWDVYLEAGKEYQIRYDGWGEKDLRAALFRNPGTGDFWGGRQDAEWEISGSVYHDYMAPQTDWYGLVVFANVKSDSSSGYEILIQEIGDCTPLTTGQCESYTGLPREVALYQDDDFWSVVAVVPQAGDVKTLSMMTQCDLVGTNLAQTTTTGTGIIVCDFNHTARGTYYPTITGGDPSAPYAIQADTGKDPVDDIFPLDEIVTGSVGGSSGECGLVRIWDVWLRTGTTYNIGFTSNFDADIRLALFHNPGNGTFWATNSDCEFEMSETGNLEYTASVSDWYGLVVFANEQDVPGDYTIRISEHGATAIGDLPEVPTRFALHQNAPNPFNPSTVIRYDVPSGGARISLRIFDVNGQLVRTLVDAVEPAGEKSVTWNGVNNRGGVVATGVYFYRLNAPGYTQTRKMLLMK
ncbi:MAG: T9SS type A sorting domain-containing protein [Candidatus Latescibacterota bacterium]|nr:MAG: T9SS type A sorting domain-containing protein [Candidatus Latescibacterota bacterium]